MSMRLMNYSVAFTLLIVVYSVSVKAQDLDDHLKSIGDRGEVSTVKREVAANSRSFVLKRSNESSPQTADYSYVFPNGHQRFKRYVMNTVGPISLFKNAATAGIAQWTGSPEEAG